jgi:probable rRNA maturation factor
VKLHVDIQCATGEAVPAADDIRNWIAAALHGRSPRSSVEVSVRIVDTAEMTTLNQSWRGKPGATNVLSFPTNLPAELPVALLGDIVICAPVVAAEAAQQHKAPAAHWAHMTIHGTLHLLGYDHINEDDARLMEALESTILNELNYPCPYDENQYPEHCAP